MPGLDLSVSMSLTWACRWIVIPRPYDWIVLAMLSVMIDRTIGRHFYRIHRYVYQATGGLIGHRSLTGPMLLLTTVGRISGRPRTTPLLYMPDGSCFVVVGSNGGREQQPGWVLNLSRTPSAEIRVGRRRLSVEAHILTGEEKASRWPRLVDFHKGWGHYQSLTERELKVASFTPTATQVRATEPVDRG